MHRAAGQAPAQSPPCLAINARVVAFRHTAPPPTAPRTPLLRPHRSSTRVPNGCRPPPAACPVPWSMRCTAPGCLAGEQSLARRQLRCATPREQLRCAVQLHGFSQLAACTQLLAPLPHHPPCLCSYVDSVRANIVAAGDNCSRILFGGALWAASVSRASGALGAYRCL